MKINPVVKEVLEWGYCIIIAVILALIFRYYIGTPTIVQQTSMYPTLKSNDRLLLNRWHRTIKADYQRGDIITFEGPSRNAEVSLENPVAKYEDEPQGLLGKFVYYVLEMGGKESYIKRVIGLPGEHVKIEDGKVYINGEVLDEPYLQEDVVTSRSGAYYDLVVPEGTLFVMGDNRTKSTDSRSFGCVPIEKIESKVWIRFWPFNVFGEVK